MVVSEVGLTSARFHGFGSLSWVSSRRSSRSVGARSRALRSIVPDAVDEVSLARRENSGPIGMEVGGVSCQKNVAVSKSLEELAREAARVQGQPAGKGEDSETSDENGPHHLMCRDGRSVESLLE